MHAHVTSRNFKDTPAGRIPVDWRCLPLREVAEFKSGGTPSRKSELHEKYFKDGNIPWVKTTDLNNGAISSTEESITKTGLHESSCEIVPAGTVLVAMYGGFNQIGRTGILTKPSAFNQALSAILTDAAKLLPQFLLHSFNARVADWRRIAASSRKDPNITKADVEGFPIAIPPLSTQKKIVQILDAWDHAIKLSEELHKEYIGSRRALMQQVLTGKRRFTEFRQKPWITVRIGDLLRAEDRYADFDDNTLYRLISIRRRSGGAFPREALYGREIKTKVLKVARAGDFIISRMQVVHGALGAVPSEFDGFLVSDSYDVLVPRDQSRLDMAFFNYLSQRPEIYRLALISSHGVHIEKMTFVLEDFLNEKVLIPPSVAEQRLIAAALKSCDDEIADHEKQVEYLREQKRGLMQKLLTGHTPLGA